MLPESMAPPLANYDEFKVFMVENGAIVRRVYEPAWEDPETGEISDSYWQILVERSELCSDGKFHIHALMVRDEDVATAWRNSWSLTLKVLDMGWQGHLEEAGLA